MPEAPKYSAIRRATATGFGETWAVANRQGLWLATGMSESFARRMVRLLNTDEAARDDRSTE